MLLGSHPELVTTGELKLGSLTDAERYLCSCRQPLRSCQFWQGVTSGMRTRGFEFEPTHAGTDFLTDASSFEARLLRPLHRGPALEAARDALLAVAPGARARLRRLQARNAALVASVLETSGAKIVVDSSKTGVRLKYLLKNPALDVQIVRVLRDGRGVALTYMDPGRFADAKDPALRGGGTGRSNEGRFVMSMAEAARLWRRSNEEADAVLATLPASRYVKIRYEDLCLHTGQTLERIFDLLGVDASRRPENFRAVEQHVVGNGMRLDTEGEVKLDDRWRTALGPAELEEFERVAGALNRSYGYSPLDA